ncbi:hypothetical protein [Ferrimicrobium sp.]|uniref:RsiG family protein n=1 Tax=Ferrimicrobium sp. TaxID=2926050 RepID=UPI002606C2C9|nr:hypothetical protein [Ferrimicrobium sp.]
MADLRVQINQWLEEVDELDLGQTPVESLRTLRDLGRRLENSISYARRVLQTRLDIATELDTAQPASIASVVAPHSDPSPLAERHVEVEIPEDDMVGAEAYLRLLVGGDRTHSLDLLDEAQLASYQARLQEGERTISGLRRQLHQRLDRLGSELVRRYQQHPVSGV